MHRVKVALATLLLCGGLLLAAGVAVDAQAAVDGPVYVNGAKHRAQVAHRAAVRAERKAEAAGNAARQTRTVTATYGAKVGRWVSLALDVGWPRGTIGQLAYIINRESGGCPGALNESSGAAGLLQFMPQWYQGEWGYPAFDPFDARANLTAGVHLWRDEGWQPWSL